MVASGGISPLNRVLSSIPKRAEGRQAEQLRETFVDSGVAAALESIDHQVLYGRRGTGKTHAFRYLQTVVQDRGDISFYADLRTIGSPEGLFMGQQVAPTERAARLLIDLLGQFHDAVLAAVVEDAELIGDNNFVAKLDAVGLAITSMQVDGTDVELSREGESSSSTENGVRGSLGVHGGAPAVEVGLTGSEATGQRLLQKETRRGAERRGLNFSDVAQSLRNLARSLTSRRIWFLFDEWSSVPADVQPYLGEFLVRCVLPLQEHVTVKIAAIEQQTSFRTQLDSGDVIGIELGADVAANVDLDEFMVFEQNEDQARGFFRGLFFKHVTAGHEGGLDPEVEEIRTEAELVRQGFTDKRAFDELVRAAEGVPRDAINIASKAAIRAMSAKISVPDVRAAARAWFQSDKESALQGQIQALPLLNWIIDRVIRGKRARGFLVSQSASNAPLLLALFDARVLHVVRKGYSAQDQPGERYDVYVIDYGAYVDLIQTQSAPLGMLPLGEEEGEAVGEGEYVDVPTQDLRAIRRAVLDLEEFTNAQPQLSIEALDGNRPDLESHKD
jgi:hypothetical protein